MTTAPVDQVIEQIGALPVLPQSAHRLAEVVSDPHSTLAQIVGTIRYDQTMTAELLRLCNSAYFGLARRIESLDDAVCLLGTVKVFQLVMAAHTRSLLNRPQQGYGLPAGALWAHSVCVGLAAQLVARRLHLPARSTFFTIGLLHDIGKVVLNEFVGREYAEIVRRVTEEQLSFCEAEQQVLGYTHAEAGARLAETWNLPPAIVKGVRYHHDPHALAEPDPLVDVVHIADAVSLVFGVGTGDDGLCYRVHPAILARHGLNEADVEAVGAAAIGELRTVQALFSAK